MQEVHLAELCFHLPAAWLMGSSGADGSAELKCTPEVEARVFRDTWGVAQRTFGRLGRLTCPVAVAAGTETMPGVIMAPELEAPRIAAQIPNGRFEQCALVVCS